MRYFRRQMAQSQTVGLRAIVVCPECMTLLVTSRKSFFSQFSIKLRQMYGWQLLRRHVATCTDHLLSMDSIQNTSQKILLYLHNGRLDSAIIIANF